jgi:hypothetical protein
MDIVAKMMTSLGPAFVLPFTALLVLVVWLCVRGTSPTAPPSATVALSVAIVTTTFILYAAWLYIGVLRMPPGTCEADIVFARLYCAQPCRVFPALALLQTVTLIIVGRNAGWTNRLCLLSPSIVGLSLSLAARVVW